MARQSSCAAQQRCARHTEPARSRRSRARTVRCARGSIWLSCHEEGGRSSLHNTSTCGHWQERGRHMQQCSIECGVAQESTSDSITRQQIFDVCKDSAFGFDAVRVREQSGMEVAHRTEIKNSGNPEVGQSARLAMLVPTPEVVQNCDCDLESKVHKSGCRAA